jgi:hypothetical protein
VTHNIVTHNIDSDHSPSYRRRMPFINRHLELARLDAFARDIGAGTPERNLALIGVRRIGKSKILEHFRDGLPTEDPLVVVNLQMDAASTTLPTYLLTMTSAVVDGLLRQAGRPTLGQAPSPTDIAAAAAGFNEHVSSVISDALRIVSEARPDGQRVFVAATTLPERIAAASGRPVMVHADEFQHIQDLATYSPFRTGRGRAAPAAFQNVLKVLRPAIERRPRVGWVITGSSTRLLTDILGKGPLMGRFDIVEVKAFDPSDTRALARTIWDERGVPFTDEATDRVDALTYGHPFYADVVSKAVALNALALSTPATRELVDHALLESVVDPAGAIYITCEEIWDSITNHFVPAVRGMVSKLAELGVATAGELAVAIGLPGESAAWRHAQELERLGIVERGEAGKYTLVDPIFRFWLAAANSLGGVPGVADPLAANRAIKNYEQAYLRERADRGRFVEAYVRDLIRSFDGQQIEGRRLGLPGRHIRVPNGSDVRRIAVNDPAGEVFGYSAEVELDACFGKTETWLVEVRDRTRKPSRADVELLARKATYLRRAGQLPPGRAWLITFAGLGQEARDRATELGILVSGDSDVRAIADVTGVQRPGDQASI